ncbi:anti-sigma factor domain-containing protein [Lentibacillus juripiscarius]|uniref:Anti-sigma factor domain-containing protein n=1 Tax=Lentibacillus juripiscarius TaxID=257446 RepID=A0ABW5VAZ2_9BACI
MAFHDHIPEQVLIDCALGNLSEDKKTVVIRHTDECHSCRSILESWESLLSDMNEERSVQPPDTIKEKLDASLAKEDKKTAMKRKFKPAYLMGSAAAVLLLTAGLITTDGTRTVTNEKVVYNEAIHKAGIQEKPNTRQLEIIPVSRFDHVSGNIWINNTTGEMLVEIDGLFQLNDRHYQLWMIDENDDVKGEPLPIENGSVKVLYRGRDVQQFKRIKTSVEPPGGSDRPTGPETFTVDLEEGMSY